jgi:tripartite-type tricarboxylate transporter receptor subunit TctC
LPRGARHHRLRGAGARQAGPTARFASINPFPAGGGVDAFARPIAAKLTQRLGQSFYVENMGGAGGTVGAAAAAKAPPDGYTIFVGAIHHAIAESLYTKLTYNIEKDFDPVHGDRLGAERDRDPPEARRHQDLPGFPRVR